MPYSFTVVHILGVKNLILDTSCYLVTQPTQKSADEVATTLAIDSIYILMTIYPLTKGNHMEQDKIGKIISSDNIITLLQIIKEGFAASKPDLPRQINSLKVKRRITVKQIEFWKAILVSFSIIIYIYIFAFSFKLKYVLNLMLLNKKAKICSNYYPKIHLELQITCLQTKLLFVLIATSIWLSLILQKSKQIKTVYISLPFSERQYLLH